MNNEVKVNLSITLPGRVMISEQAAQNKPENYESFSMIVTNVNNKKKKDSERITVKVRKCVPALQSINLSVDAYKAMTSKAEVPSWSKIGAWAAMSEKQRLEAHLKKITEALGGLSFTYKVLDN